jgi:hypothetical protein
VKLYLAPGGAGTMGGQVPAYTINASQYHHLAWRMFLQSSGKYEIQWRRVYSDSLYTTGPLDAEDLWHVYSLDMSEYPEWKDFISHLWISPTDQPDEKFAIGWVKLTTKPIVYP